VPPLSPIQAAAETGKIGMENDLPDVHSLRIPVRYLANLLTAGQEAPIELALQRMLAMRAFMRGITVDGVVKSDVLERVGLTQAQVEEMYRYMAIANYEDRFVIPTSHREYAGATFDAYGEQGGCGFSFGNSCSTGNTKENLFGGKKLTQRGTVPIKIPVVVEPSK
jgi:nitrate reductase beta subunit